MPACKPDTLAFRTFLAALGAAAAMAVAARAAVPVAPVPVNGAAAAAGFRYFDPADDSAVPPTLSAMGIYAGAPGKNAKLVPGAYHFDVNSPLWSDDAKKKRWVLVPANAHIGFRTNDDYWDYPDSAVFVKEFAIDTIPGDTNSRVLMETRILINKKEQGWDSTRPEKIDTWYGFTYRWDKDQKDARLVGKNAVNDSIRIWPQGLKKPSRMKKWAFPSRNQCLQCHRTDQPDGLHGRTILGFFTAQLNRPHPDSAAVNQIDYFFLHDLLRGQKPFPLDYAPRWRAIDDNSASVDLRARSYIAANCSGCHGKRGMETGATFGVDLNYDFHTMEAKMEFRHRTVSWPFGLDTLAPFFYPKNDQNNPRHLDSLRIEPALVVPGYPEKSVILFRQRARDTRPGDYDPDRNQMPPLASFEVNEPATALIEKWIKDMPVPTDLAHKLARGRLAGESGAAVRGGKLFVDAEMLKGNAEVTMAGVDGRAVALRKLSGGVYALPDGMPKGLYFIRVGARSLMRYAL